MPAERIQKILAHAGITSRRKAEELIQLGEVTVNGKIAKLGDRAEMGKDAIKVKGKLLRATESPIYLAFNKPKQVISALSDPEGRACLTDFLDKVHARVYPVGRMDFMSEGLIFLTNDGDLAELIQKNPKIARVYHVKVKGHPQSMDLERLKRGTRVEGKAIQPHSIRIAERLQSKAKIEVVMVGGGGVDIKKLFELKGLLVEKIVRTAIGHITLKGLEPGHFRYLQKSQLMALVNQPELGMRLLEQEADKSRHHEDDEEGSPSLPAKGRIVVKPVSSSSRAKAKVVTPRSPISPIKAKITPKRREFGKTFKKRY